MIEKGILKGADRKEPNWNRVKLGEPFKKALDRFREEVLPRKDFDPTALLQFGLFMSRGVINILKEMEQSFGAEGQKAVNKALIKTGYEVGKEIIENAEVPDDVKPVELMSFLATIINTQAWTSVEEPTIDANDKCSFNILWCPLQDIYRAFDCRVQRYMVQGVIDAFREKNPSKLDYQIEFTKTIPAGGDCCRFVINEKKPGEPDKWEGYSKFLEQKAMKKLKQSNEKEKRAPKKKNKPVSPI